jgi:hypothetical protein
LTSYYYDVEKIGILSGRKAVRNNIIDDWKIVVDSHTNPCDYSYIETGNNQRNRRQLK